MALETRVPLARDPYSVWTGPGLLDEIGTRCADLGLGPKTGVLTDSNVGPLYAARAMASLEAAGFSPVLVEMPAGEASKSLAQAEAVCDAMIAAGLDRSSWVVALGGGVVGDLAGFVAAIYYRGIPYVQVPTTVLAQVDSSVGGKTGVNAKGGKNLIGAFHQPRLVLADTATLSTLPPREFREGFAEIIKHGAIRDRPMLEELSPAADLAPLMARNVAIKAAIVAEDEKETLDLRALLNFGHTVGHAIENVAGYGRFLHGEAIAIGLAAAVALSREKAGLSAYEADLVLSRLRDFGLPTALPADLDPDALMTALARDKKFARGDVRFVLVRRLGDAFVSRDVTRDDIQRTLARIRS